MNGMLYAPYIDQEQDFDIKLDIRLEDKQIKNSLIKTIEKVREKEDKNGYLKALYEGDKFALVIDKIVNYNFDKVELKKFTKSVNKQLTLFSNVLQRFTDKESDDLIIIK